MPADNIKGKKLSPEKFKEFSSLFEEFIETFQNSKKGAHHIEISKQSRKQAQEYFNEVMKAHSEGADTSDMILRKLLPYQDTKYNRVKDVWIHIAPAITKDLKSWFENVSWAKENDWPEIAKAVFVFVKNCVEEPNRLDAECKRFLDNPNVKGMQAGFLTPILNALRPEDFILINKKPLLLINHFLNTEYTSNLADYPRVNQDGLHLLKEVSGILAPATPSGLYSCDVFDHFSHWLKAIKKYWDIDPSPQTTGFWQVAPGEGARLWDNLVDESIVAVGFSKMDQNLSGYSKKELFLLFKEKYPEFSERRAKIKFTQLWNFINLKPGNNIITNNGKSSLLGACEVTGSYKFKPDRDEYRHTIPVEYYKIAQKEVPIPDEFKGKFGRTILALSESDFKKLESLLDGEIKSQNYWWLNANPKVWNFYDLKVGDYQIYTSINEKGNKRRIYSYFTLVQPGDLILCYSATPVKEVVGIGQVTKGLHETAEGEGFEFKILEQYENTLKWVELQAVPDLKNCEPLRNNQGSLFKLTQDEFETIRAMMDDINPPIGKNAPELYNKAAALKSIFMDDDKFDEMLDLLKDKKNIILQGPPGVGKTFIARHLAW